MTYSIVARDEATGAFGIAVASRFFACGAIVPHVSAHGAIATQADANPLWGIEGLPRLAEGEAAEAILADLSARDAGVAIRQVHAIGQDGDMAQHTGTDCVSWAGHVTGTNVSVAGNMLVGPAVIEATLSAYQARSSLSFAERLLAAMEAGEAEGGDKRGRQAAGLVIYKGQPYPALELRVDDDADPLLELRRLLDVSQEYYSHYAQGIPTVENFSGALDHTPIQQAIADDAARRAAQGRPTRSRATVLSR